MALLLPRAARLLRRPAAAAAVAPRSSSPAWPPSPLAPHARSLHCSAPSLESLRGSRAAQNAAAAPAVSSSSAAPPPPPSAQQQQQQQQGQPHSSAGEAPAVALANDAVSVTWSSGVMSRFHHLWLRDHCRCPVCYHATTKQRLLDTFKLSPDLQPAAAESTTEGLLVRWHAEPSADAAAAGEGSAAAAEHVSLYPWSWLRQHSYAPVLSSLSSSALPDGGPADSRGRILWGSGIAKDPPTVTHAEVQEERGVARWCAKIARYGFCFVSGVPPTPEATQALVERLSFIRPTHYGGFWDFTSNLEHGDTAYTNLRLGAHTDTTYLTDPCGLQMFHLLSHTDSPGGGTKAHGGESLLVDGFLAAQVLRDVHPAAYDILSRTRILTHSAGDDETLVRPLHPRGYPILEHDESTGELILVRYNNDDRSVLKVAEHEVMPFYDALRKWHEILTSENGEYWSQLTPGTALIFDNHRVLHGRSAFAGERRLCGAYVPHDDFRSRTAVLRTRFPDVFADGRVAPSPREGERRSRGVWDDGL